MEIVGLFDFANYFEGESDLRMYCFNSRYKFVYEVNKNKNNVFISIFVKEDSTFIEKFYGDNIENFSVCVGENGSGKTRLLNDLVDVVNGKKAYSEQNKIVIIKKDGKLYYQNILSTNFNVAVMIKKDNVELIEIDKFKLDKTILISNSIEPNHKIKEYVNFDDFSITNKLKKNSYYNVKNETVNNQVKFVLSNIIKYSTDNIISSFNINTTAQFKNTNFDKTYHDYFKSNSLTFKKIDEEIKKITQNSKNKNSDNILYELNRKFYETQVFKKMAQNDFISSTEIRDRFLELDEKYTQREFNEEKFIEIYLKFDNYLNNEVEFNKMDIIVYDRYKVFIRNLENEVDILQARFEINIKKFVSDNKNITKINNEFISSDIFQDLEITWKSISSGENALLTIFTDLSEGIENCKEKNEVLLLLDEIDIALHPDWQRIFLTNLFKFIEKDFNSEKVQMILTTHSPLILSDVRKNDVNFLTKNNSKIDFKTFGANLNELMAESFFLENSLMGEFSEEIIQKLISDEYFPKNKNYKKEQVEGLISEIGENVLRNHLLRKYDTKIGLNERINMLKKEISRLEYLEGKI